MNTLERQLHWDKIYQTKRPDEVSWYQPSPETSLYFLRRFHIPKTAKIIDVGGGDSLLVDHLLQLGYLDLTVLDISAAAIERAKIRLGEKASQVKWVVSDITTFTPTEKYDFWHDRAAFHFLTADEEIEAYVKTVEKGLLPGGILVLGTFSKKGPDKCSGIAVKKYSRQEMADRLKASFAKIHCISVDHVTPFHTSQHFIFCSFRKMR